MPAFDLSLRVVDGATSTDLVLELPAAVSWDLVHGEVCRAAGLDERTPLYLCGRRIEPALVVGLPPLLTGLTVTTERCAATGATDFADSTTAGPLQVCCLGGPDSGRAVAVLRDPVVIGRDPACDLPVADARLSWRHAELTMTVAGPVVTDLGSRNGLSVNGGPAGSASALLAEGAVLRLGGSRFVVRLTAGPRLTTTPDGRGRLVVSRPPRLQPATAVVLAPDPGPPPARTRRRLPVLAAATGIGLGVALALVTGHPMYLLMAAAGPLILIGSTLGDRWSARRSHHRAVIAHRAAMKARDASIRTALDRHRADLWEQLPDPARCRELATRPDARLWERRPGDPDFGVVTLGIGARPVELPGAGAHPVDELPVPVRLRPGVVLGIAGDAGPALARALVVQLATLHGPRDLRLSGPADLVPDSLPHLDHPTTAHGPAPPTLAVTFTRGPATPGAGTATICLADTVGRLPDGCTVIVDADAGGASMTGVNMTGASVVTRFDPLGLTATLLDQVSTALQPLTDTQPPPAIPLPDDPETLTAAWTRPGAAATIGLGDSGPIRIDLDTDGPHLLVAGTTGSGKSALLLTLITGLAAAAPPEDTAFLLVDYKGGAAFTAAAGLPHVTAVVTDLDPDLAARGLTSLRAEVRRRERRLAEAGVTELAELRSAGLTGLPRLVIVVDEFATVAAELPAFLTGLVDVAQRGRSLGLHLVLATQRPAGVISPAVRANIGTRICLRVVDESESRDVLDLPDSARLPPELPGVALLRRGRAPAVRFRSVVRTEPARRVIRVRRLDGSTTETGTEPDDVGPSELDRLIAAARALGPARPAAPWLPPLPTRLHLANPALLGLLDLPDEQAQRPWPCPSGPLWVLGPPGSGRTTALRRWAAAQAADGAELLLVDAGSGLAGVAHWPAVTGRLGLAEPELVLRLLARMAAELARRGGQPGPAIALAIDGWETVAAVLDPLDYGVWTTAVTTLAEQGPRCGIRLAVAGGLRTRHHRATASFRQLVVLGNSGGPPGRGRLGDSGAHLQLALAPASVADVPSPRARRLVVRPLPVLVHRSTLYDGGGQVPSPAGFVPIGVGDDDAIAVGWDLSVTRALLIAGPPGSGVSTALRTLADQAAEKGVPPLWATAGPDDLRARLATHQGPLLLLCDRVGELSDPVLHDLLARFVMVAGPGQTLAIGTRLDHAARALRGPIPAVAAHRTGLLLAAEGTDGRLLGSPLPRRSGTSAPGRGHLFRLGRAVPVQVALRE